MLIINYNNNMCVIYRVILAVVNSAQFDKYKLLVTGGI